MSTLSLLYKRLETAEGEEITRLWCWITDEEQQSARRKERELGALVAQGYAASDPSVQYRAEVMAGIRE